VRSLFINGRRRRRLSITRITGMVLAVAAGMVMQLRPELLGALLSPAGPKVLGRRTFNFAGRYLQKAGGVFGMEADRSA
jgi:hypothetical protein